MAMSLTCSALAEDESPVETKLRVNININQDGKPMPAIGDSLLFIKANDNKYYAYGFQRVELD